MSKIFTRTFCVRFSECNAYGQAGTAHLVRYLIETAWDWGAAHQLGMRESGELGLTWFIRETEIEQFRPLRYNDSVSLTIWLLTGPNSAISQLISKAGARALTAGRPGSIPIRGHPNRPPGGSIAWPLTHPIHRSCTLALPTNPEATAASSKARTAQPPGGLSTPFSP